MQYILTKDAALVSVHPNAAEAKAARATLTDDLRTTVCVAASEDVLFKAYSAPQLVALYNAVTGESKEKFSSKDIAASNAWEALEINHNPKVKARHEANMAAEAAEAANPKPKKADKNAAGKKDKAPKAARTPRSNYAGMRIKPLVKEVPCREGTIRRALMDAILGAKTTDAALATELADGVVVRGIDLKFAVDNGWVELAAAA